MFCLIYFSNVPSVLEISQNKQTLTQKLLDKSIQQCIDEVGQKNFINTLDLPKDLTEMDFPVYPNFGLKKISEDSVQVFQVQKKQIVEKGYIYNSTKEIKEITLVGTYYIVPVESWKYDDLPRRPEEEKRIVVKPVEKQKPVFQQYDKVLLELIESIQKRKVD